MKKKKLAELLLEMQSSKQPTCNPEPREVRAVVVFTANRGVFFGYTDADAIGNVHLDE